MSASVPATPELPPGTIIGGKYELRERLGTGGFASVYRAKQPPSPENVAVKLLHGRRLADDDAVRRFEREVAMLSRLRHPNIVSFIDYACTDEGVPFLVLELLRGESLQEKLAAEGAISVWRAGQIALQVLGALSFAHELNVVHRDIKPANIFLCAGETDTYARVLDFGVAKVLHDGDDEGALTKLTTTGEILGTPPYMAPEQVRGVALGPTVDIYAFGLVMAELLTGRRAVEGNEAIEVYMRHISEAPIDFTEAVTDSVFGGIIERACQKHAGRRYPSAEAMRADVEAQLRTLYGALSDT